MADSEPSEQETRALYVWKDHTWVVGQEPETYAVDLVTCTVIFGEPPVEAWKALVRWSNGKGYADGYNRGFEDGSTDNTGPVWTAGIAPR